MVQKSEHTLYTVGHSNQSADDLVRLLRAQGITAVGDVRSVPFTRHFPWFNTDQLRPRLKLEGIQYVPLGRELGARPQDSACYRDGRVDLGMLAHRPEFKRGLARIMLGLSAHRICLMCSEADPMQCHRAIVICRALRPQGIVIQHILGDGTTEAHSEMERRMVRSLGLGPNLFEPDLTTDVLIERAYEEQAARIAYSAADASPTETEATALWPTRS